MKYSKLPWLLAMLSGSLLIASCSDTSSEKIKPTAVAISQHSMINGEKDLNPNHVAVVSLYMDMGYSSYSACTGTLIHPQWVLTAGHCVTDESSYGGVTASSYNRYYKVAFGNTDDELKQNLHEVDQIIFHENYGSRDIDSDYGTIQRDIALVKLKEPVSASIAKPILPLPKWLGINRAAVANGVNVEFVGFGYNENGDSGTKLSFSASLSDYCGTADGDPDIGCKYGEVLVNGCHPDKSYCSSWYYASYCKNGYFCLSNYTDYVWLPQGSIYYEQDDGGPCQGDSGGPAFIKVGGVEYVAGLTSYGDAACAKTGISTAVQDYYDWIISKAPEVASQFVEVCGNGLDDDGNGIVDDCNENDSDSDNNDDSSDSDDSGNDNDIVASNGYKLCADEYIAKCKANYGDNYGCFQDAEYAYCAEICSNLGDVRNSCEPLADGRDAQFVDVCTNVGGQLLYVTDLNLSHYCNDFCADDYVCY